MECQRASRHVVRANALAASAIALVRAWNATLYAFSDLDRDMADFVER
jgi:hypothetical protein